MTKNLKENLIAGISMCLLGAILAFGINIEQRLNKIETDVAFIKGKMSKNVASLYP